MTIFDHHLFVCGNQRSPGHPRGCCNPEGTDVLRAELKATLKKRNIAVKVRVNKAGCLDQCENGPVIVIYPQGVWYGGVRREDVTRIVESLETGEILDDLLITEDSLNNPECSQRSSASEEG